MRQQAARKHNAKGGQVSAKAKSMTLTIYCKVVCKQWRALLWDLLFLSRMLVRWASPDRRCSPIGREQDFMAGRCDGRWHCRALLLCALAPATYEPDSVGELAASKTKGKIILSLTSKSCFSILSSVLTDDLHFSSKTRLIQIPTR